MKLKGFTFCYLEFCLVLFSIDESRAILNCSDNEQKINVFEKKSLTECQPYIYKYIFMNGTKRLCANAINDVHIIYKEKKIETTFDRPKENFRFGMAFFFIVLHQNLQLSQQFTNAICRDKQRVISQNMTAFHMMPLRISHIFLSFIFFLCLCLYLSLFHSIFQSFLICVRFE